MRFYLILFFFINLSFADSECEEGLVTSSPIIGNQDIADNAKANLETYKTWLYDAQSEVAKNQMEIQRHQDVISEYEGFIKNTSAQDARTAYQGVVNSYQTLLVMAEESLKNNQDRVTTFEDLVEQTKISYEQLQMVADERTFLEQSFCLDN